MVSNEIGEIVEQQLLWLPENFKYIILDEWIIMPNHVHMILKINKNFDDIETGKIGKNVGTGRDGKIFGNDLCVGNVLERSLQNAVNKKILPLYRVVGAFKTTSSKIIHLKGRFDFKWQKSFHDRVIRNEQELINIRAYIKNNPLNWATSKNNPKNFK